MADQPGYWTTNLMDATLQAGEQELVFPVSERQVDGGRDWAARRYPFRNGQSDEDVGARPRSLQYTVPLWRDVEEEQYPNLFNDLVEFIESDTHKGRATLIDLEFGPLPVRMTGYSWGTTGKQRDGGELRMTFETLGDENFTLLTVEGSGANEEVRASDEAANLDQSLADAGKTPKDNAAKLKEKKVAITETERLELGLSQTFSANVGLAAGVNVTIPQVPALADAFTTTVQASTGFAPTTVADDGVRVFTQLVERYEERVSTGAIVDADEVATETDTLLARIAAVRDDTTLTADPEKGWPVFNACSRLAAAVQRIADRAFLDAPRVVDYTLTKEQSAFEVAVALFEDPARVADIIELNPGLSPDFYPRGTQLIVPLD